MPRCLLLPVAFCAAIGFSSLLFPQDPASSGSQAKGTRTANVQMTVEAVLVDIVVRDKNGRPITDLKPEEIEVYEDNVRQTVKSVDFVQQEMAFEESRKSEAKPSAVPLGAPPAVSPISSLAHINLVTFVFDNLSLEGRRLALQACEDFVKTELHENVLVSVFVIDRRLHVMQQFTNEAALVREAAKRAAGRTYTQYLEQSEGIRNELQKLTQASAGVEAAAGAIGRGNPGGGGAIGQAAVQAQLASMTLESLMRSEEMEREQQGQSSLHALLALIHGQKRLAGRKTVVYYSEGLVVPPAWVTLLKAVIGEANRSNLSFYSVDARGLTATTLLGSSRSTLSNAAATSRSQTFGRTGQPVTRSQVMAAEQGESSLRMNAQGTLDDLALSTGGFLIAESNDLRVGMKRIGEDIRGYYEVTYSPKQLVYDGKFRSIAVKVARPNVTVQSRSGYFAIPASADPALPNVSSFELPLLGLLSAPELPREVDYRAQFLRFGGDAAATQYVLVLEVPLSEVSFQEVKDPDGKTTYRMRFAVLALVKDSSGQVLEKFSQDYPVREIPSEQLAAMKRGHLLFIRQLSLSPGRHTIESVVREEETQKAGARKTVVVVPEPKPGLSISSLTAIRRTDKANPEDLDRRNPLAFGEMKIVPSVGEAITATPEARVEFFVVVYPAKGVAEQPKLVLELAQNGTALGRGELELPKPDSDGRIPYIATLPVGNLQPGDYEIRAIATQGSEAVQERTFITVAGAKQ